MTNLSIVEALGQIAREKNVDRELVVLTLQDALISAAKRRYGSSDNYHAKVDPSTGTMEVTKDLKVVEEVFEDSEEISIDDARDLDSKAQIGSVVVKELNFADFGRNAIQTAKQILVQRVREAEREKIYEEFIGRVGIIESGTVQQISHGDIVLTLGRAEAAIPYREQIRRERYRQGESVRGYIYEVLKSSRGPQILLSRAHPEFLRKLFIMEVPEISEGIVQIHAVAREPGERAKIAVSTNDERVDPVGACVGIKGSRVQTIVRELSGERIDIVPWIDEPQIFIGRALSPANVTRVITDNRRKHASVIVEDDQLSLAIGKSGQNSRLAVQLTGWGLDIITEAQYQERRDQQEVIQQHFRKLDGVSELMALSLTTSGFDTIKSIAEASLDLLKTVPGLEEEETAEKLRQTAQLCIDEGEDAVDLLPEIPKAEVKGTEKLPSAETTPEIETQLNSNPNDNTSTSNEEEIESENDKTDSSENNVEA
ncbi:MAG: transcription termination factor NusA [Candidatus Latescibacterota bacterium]|nr:transcription termination factor NusA [Candidatus Latescibacterota bacterium]